jgi:hypothetical protein
LRVVGAENGFGGVGWPLLERCQGVAQRVGGEKGLNPVIEGDRRTHLSHGRALREAPAEIRRSREIPSRDRRRRQPPTKGKAGGKHPIGNGVSRFPARSWAAASR